MSETSAWDHEWPNGVRVVTQRAVREILVGKPADWAKEWNEDVHNGVHPVYKTQLHTIHNMESMGEKEGGSL